MAGYEPGEVLRMWRERLGFTLETAAHGVEVAAHSAGINPKSKKIPRTHASLSRWETGKVEVKTLGLELLAIAYGVSDPEDLRKPPPPENTPPKRTVEVDASDAPAVEAFIESLQRAKGG